MTDEQAWDRLFDELYLKTYAPLQESEQAETMAREAIALARCEPGADVLDVPCGFGRHSLVLARDGYRVVGLERSPALLDEARSRSDGSDWPRWVNGDYRDLPFEDASFDAVLHLFTSFGYYGEADDLRMFEEFRRVLRPRGALVVETMHRDRLVRIFQPRTWEALPDGAVVVEMRSFDPVRGVVRTEQTYRPLAGEPESVIWEHRAYTATEVDTLLERAGFSERAHHGSLGGEPLTTDSRLVIVARP